VKVDGRIARCRYDFAVMGKTGAVRALLRRAFGLWLIPAPNFCKTVLDVSRKVARADGAGIAYELYP